MKTGFIVTVVTFAVWTFSLQGARADIQYETKIAVADDGLRQALEQASQLIALNDKHPDIVAALRRRARDDLARLKSVMDAKGYYDAALTFTMDPGGKPDFYRVTVTVEPGSLYRFEFVRITLPDGGKLPEINDVTPEALGLARGGPAEAEAVVAGQSKLQQAYAGQGWPYVKVTGRHDIADELRDMWTHESKDLERTYLIRTLQGIGHQKGIRMTFLSGGKRNLLFFRNAYLY